MKKHFIYMFLITVLCVFFTFPNTLIYAASSGEAYDDGYDEGWYDGVEHADEDIDQGNRKSYSRAIPSNDEIIEDYDLESQSTSYRNDFIDGYKDGFREGYNSTFEEEDEKKDKDDEDESVDYAKSLGTEMGKAYGSSDFYNGKSNDWKKALPSNSNLIKFYELKKETKEFRDKFIEIFKNNFKSGYEAGYEDAKYSPYISSYDKGKSDGGDFGKLLGDIYGKRDFYLGNNSDWERNLPSVSEIINDFSLRKDSDEYKDAFVSSFSYSFEKSYNEAYRNSNNLLNNITSKTGYDNGREIGLKKGKGYAQIDIILGQPINTTKYTIFDTQFILEFNLNYETEEYKEGFISGYNEGLTEGYINEYQNLSYNSIIDNIETKLIPISGGEVSTIDKRFKVVIDKGTYYNDIVLSLEGLSNAYSTALLSNHDLIKASDIYTLKVSNPYQKYDNNKLIKLEFEYYGPQTGGIYKYINNKWTYLPSKIEENRIITYIRPYSLSTLTGIYAVFIDEDAVITRDIRGHWAKDEITTFINRDIVKKYSDGTFRPNSPISRGQLLELLSKVYNWNLNNLDESLKVLEKIDDYDSLRDNKNLVAYALKHGYMGFFQDNTFKEDNSISYNQLNNIMRKVTGDNSFNWYNTAYYMMMDKDTLSKSYNSMDNSVTRAEAVYMLYLINEWKY